ncbi:MULTISPECIES: hypothetical protein [Myroides]|uniref:DUF7832 domain-containing protein n=1 Tax=Myroides albus TaxID=2562892 RepID=A0A6I3LFJ8_9FLAO|nr:MULTISPECIES: hypothetical protein [Myroides]MTG98249.1 hypothetical protein [Myroides albus]MVX35311.1 hypothetical protein [Myroides sp. LoEW2-1]UVD79025.1 hypothetical protein NWE55_12960 [Myroides albus]
MSKYDDASWHYGGDYPQGLADECAATHIGMFLKWCIEKKLYSQELFEDSEQEIEELLEGELTGAEFLLEVCDEKFVSYDLNEQGNAFAKAYYDEDTAFTAKYNSYLEDYTSVFNQKAHQANQHFDSIYHVADTQENYLLIKTVIDKRYIEWLAYMSE